MSSSRSVSSSGRVGSCNSGIKNNFTEDHRALIERVQNMRKELADWRERAANIRGSFSSTRLYLEHLPTTSSGMVASAGNYALQRGPLPQAVVQTLRKNFRTSEVSALPLARGCYTNVSQRTFNIRVEAQARGPRDDNWVTFDGEEEWDDGSSGLSGPIVQQSFRAVGMVIDRVTDMALQMAPEDASPTAVRAAVSGGLILLSLSFVKGIISFFITIGTIIFGAFVAVKVFGLDVGGSSSDRNNRRGRVSRGNGGRNNRSSSARSNRREDPPSLSSGVAGLINGVLGGSESDSDDGLIDVWFERKSGKGKKKK